VADTCAETNCMYLHFAFNLFCYFMIYVAETRRASVATVTASRSLVTASSVRESLLRTNALPSRPLSAPKMSAKDSLKSNKSECVNFLQSSMKSVLDTVMVCTDQYL